MDPSWPRPRFHLDQAARLGVHGGEPHHVRIVLTKTLGAVDGAFLVADLGQDGVLLELGVGEVGLFLAVDLVERRLGDVDVASSMSVGTRRRASSG